MGGQKQEVATYFNQPFYLSKTFDIRLRHEIIQALMPRTLSGLRCLDAGCGDGSLSLSYLPELESLTLVDVSERMLEKVECKIPPELSDRVTLCHQTIDELRVDRQFDVILCVGVLAHVPDVQGTLKKLAGLLVTGGFLIVQITDSGKWVSKLSFFYNRLLDLLLRRYGYKRNKMSGPGILEKARRLSLRLLEQERYGLIAPGMQALISDDLLFWYHRFVYRSRRLARWGSDVIFKFEKCDAEGEGGA